MARFRSKVTEICCIRRNVGGDADGYPVVRVTLETGESFVIAMDEEEACWTVGHSFSVCTDWKGPDMIVLYDEMPPREVWFAGSSEAYKRYDEAFT